MSVETEGNPPSENFLETIDRQLLIKLLESLIREQDLVPAAKE